MCRGMVRFYLSSMRDQGFSSMSYVVKVCEISQPGKESVGRRVGLEDTVMSYWTREKACSLPTTWIQKDPNSALRILLPTFRLKRYSCNCSRHWSLAISNRSKTNIWSDRLFTRVA
jgi:hypothetical protein